MQNKGAIRLFAIILAIACLYELSYTYVTNNVKQDATAYAETILAEENISDMDSLSKRQKSLEQTYKDSIDTKGYDLFGFINYDYNNSLSHEINLGLDLRGGMNVILEVSVTDVIKVPTA